MKRRMLSATIVFTSLSVCLGAPPNILFFFKDDQRHDTLGCAGYPIVETPTNDRLAAQGARFTNMFVTRSTCWASHTNTLTGLTWRYSVKGDGSDQIKPEALTQIFTRSIARRGYRTGFFGKWHGKIPKDFKPEEHFDEYERIFRRPYFKMMPDGSKRHEMELIADRGIEFLKSQKENRKPFCPNLWYNAGQAVDNDRVPGTGHFPRPKAMDGKYDEIDIPEPRLSGPAIT